MSSSSAEASSSQPSGPKLCWCCSLVRLTYCKRHLSISSSPPASCSSCKVHDSTAGLGEMGSVALLCLRTGLSLLSSQTWKSEGFFALYKGFWPNWLRLGPWNIIVSFSVGRGHPAEAQSRCPGGTPLCPCPLQAAQPGAPSPSCPDRWELGCGCCWFRWQKMALTVDAALSSSAVAPAGTSAQHLGRGDAVE